MSWTVKGNGTPGIFVNGRSLALNLSFHWNGDGIVETAAVEMWVDCCGINTFWPIQTSLLGPQELRSGSHAEMTQYFPLLLSPQSLSEIEAKRASTGEVIFGVHCNVIWRGVLEMAIDGADGRDRKVRLLEAPRTQSHTLQIVVGRDQWLGMLKGLGWSEVAVFEVPAPGPSGNTRLSEALKHVRSCEESYRLGMYPSAVTEARKAIEVAAGITGDMDGSQRRSAFEKLLADVFPGPANDPRRSTLDDLMKALVHLRNEGGAHGSIRFQIERADAELSLRVVLSVFGFMGRHLKTDGS